MTGNINDRKLVYNYNTVCINVYVVINANVKVTLKICMLTNANPLLLGSPTAWFPYCLVPLQMKSVYPKYSPPQKLLNP